MKRLTNSMSVDEALLFSPTIFLENLCCTAVYYDQRTDPKPFMLPSIFEKIFFDCNPKPVYFIKCDGAYFTHIENDGKILLLAQTCFGSKKKNIYFIHFDEYMN